MKRCARCNQPLTEKWIYSRFTRNAYCVDMTACDKRFAVLKKRKEPAA